MSAQKSLKTLTPAQFAFIKWLSEKHPNLLRAAEDQHASLNGFMDTLTNVFTTVSEKAPDLLKQYVSGKQQIDELKLNLQRAKLNQYPVDEYGRPYTGGAMAPPSSMSNILPFALAGGAVLLILLALRK